MQRGNFPSNAPKEMFIHTVKGGNLWQSIERGVERWKSGDEMRWLMMSSSSPCARSAPDFLGFGFRSVASLSPWIGLTCPDPY
jgi:hypothetical protein